MHRLKYTRDGKIVTISFTLGGSYSSSLDHYKFVIPTMYPKILTDERGDRWTFHAVEDVCRDRHFQGDLVKVSGVPMPRIQPGDLLVLHPAMSPNVVVHMVELGDPTNPTYRVYYGLRVSDWFSSDSVVEIYRNQDLVWKRK